MARDDDVLIVGSEHTLRVYFFDSNISAKTGIKTETALDLTQAANVKAVVQLSNGSTVEHGCVKANQTTDTGYATYTLTAGDLVAGQVIVQGKFTDGAGLTHYGLRQYYTAENPLS